MSPFILLPFLLATSRKSFEVCLSPGCIADGASTTLDRMRALASPQSCTILPGGCVSGCGKGPVVIELDEGEKKAVHKRVEGDALLRLLDPNPSEDLVRGYDLVTEGQVLAGKKDYVSAVTKLEEGVELGLRPAMDLASGDVDTDDASTRPCLEWMVRAHRLLSTSLLETGEKDKALEVAKKACELSNQSDPESWEALAGVCQARKDAEGELGALRALFALKDNADIPRDVANRRRTQGFRLAKLEREVGK